MNATSATVAVDTTPKAPSAPRPAASTRLLSVDALRGFDMFWIVGAAAVVRTLQGISDNAFTRFLAEQFEHSAWVGVRFYDVIYPLFLFVMGVSIVFSLDRARERERKSAIVARILRRGLLLYVLNFIYNGGFSTRWPDIRVASGVLGMIAACYVPAALLYCFLADRIKTLAGITVALLLGYWALLGLVPFPDFHLDDPTVTALVAKAGSDSPAAVAAVVPARVSGVFEKGYNLSNYLDYRFLPGKLPNKYYEHQGLLSPLCAVTLCLFGIFAGRLFKAGEVPPMRKVAWLAGAGASAAALGWLWGLEFPVVKDLWSSSFCLVTGGYSALLLAAFYLVVDVWKFDGWCTPFVWIGVNPITLYLVGSSLIGLPRIADRLAGGDVKAFLNSTVEGLGTTTVALVSLALLLLLARFLHRRSIFLRL